MNNNFKFKDAQSTKCSSLTACMKALTDTLSPTVGSFYICFALLYIALNFPILYEYPICSNNTLISSLGLGTTKSYSEIPSSVKVLGNSKSIASDSSP